MRKIVAYMFLVVLVSTILLCMSKSADSSTIVFDQNVEVLASDEVDMEMLKELLNQEIWRYAIAAWQVGEYAIYCETAGCLQCPVPGLT